MSAVGGTEGLSRVGEGGVLEFECAEGRGRSASVVSLGHFHYGSECVPLCRLFRGAQHLCK